MPSLPEFSIRARASVPDDSTFGIWLPILFDILQGLGGLGNLALILTLLLSREVRRHSTWLNFCVAWVISSVSFLLLPMAGYQVGAHPPLNYCLVAATLTYGAPVLTAYAMMALVAQLWFVMSSMGANPKKTASSWRTCTVCLVTLLDALIVLPYVVYIAVMAVCFVMGFRNPDTVMRAGSDVYCVIRTSGPGKVNTGLCVLAVVITLVFEVLIARYCVKQKRANRLAGKGDCLPVGMLVRVGIFTIVGIIAIGISFVFVTRIFSPLPNIFIALLPLSAFLVFGTQLDILKVWMFWKK